MRSAAALGELADLVRARKGWQQVSEWREAGTGPVRTYLESIESFGLLHDDGRWRSVKLGGGLRRSVTDCTS